MDAKVETVYKKLTETLEEMTKLYRQLLDVVRKEKDFLIKVEVIEIDKARAQKEELINKCRIADMLREKYAYELGSMIGLANNQRPRLMELAAQLPMKQGDTLRQMHSGLEMIIKRLQGLNRENETYAQSALKTLSGALGNIKETLAGKSTYERKGQYKSGPEVSGNFVSKEA
jgi:flagellar biosynthesis/type III secretory pathway chaperone